MKCCHCFIFLDIEGGDELFTVQLMTTLLIEQPSYNGSFKYSKCFLEISNDDLPFLPNKMWQVQENLFRVLLMQLLGTC